MDMSEKAYVGFLREELILRDHLAADRTILANERTLLAYIRTALTLFVAGLSFVRFFGALWIVAVGWAFVPLAGAICVVGVVRYRRRQCVLAPLRRPCPTAQRDQ